MAKLGDSASSTKLFFIFAGVLGIYLIGPADSQAATSFGIEYRHLSSSSPGSTADTSTSVTVGGGLTGSLYIKPFTTGSTSTGTPNTSAIVGYGWRTQGNVGSVIPQGTWSFTLTTKSSQLVGAGVAKVFAYSTDHLGSNVVGIGSATGTLNVFSSLIDQQQTLSFSTSSATDLTNRVLVVEYWLEVTSAPLLSTSILFSAGSSSQTVVPPSSGTYYLSRPSLFSVGEDESINIADSAARSVSVARNLVETGVISDSVNRTSTLLRIVVETTESRVSEVTSRLFNSTRLAADGIAVLDPISRTLGSIVLLADTVNFLDQVAMSVLDMITPPDSDLDENHSGNRGGRSQSSGVNPLSTSEVSIASVTLLNSKAESITYSTTLDQVTIIIELQNDKREDQEYVLIIQILDEEDVVSDIRILNGSLQSGQDVKLTHPWVSSLPGAFEIDFILLDSLGYAPSLLSEMEIMSLRILF